MLSVEQGYEVEPKLRACLSLVKKLMVQHGFEINEQEAKLLRSFEINEGLNVDDFCLMDCLDLHSVKVSDYGKAALIDYLADITKEKFWFAKDIKIPNWRV